MAGGALELTLELEPERAQGVVAGASARAEAEEGATDLEILGRWLGERWN